MPNYGDPQYWEDRYKESQGKVFEWLEDYTTIYPVFEYIVKQLPIFESSPDWKSKLRILNLGCGNSILAENLYDEGFTNICNMDISSVVI